jgi:phospholipid/cholesterol/gamma-HCH transport system substrate-binding protein
MGDPRFKNLELKVGFFIFVAFVMLLVFLFGFLAKQNFFTPKVKVVFVSDSGEGLSKSMPVMYSGFQIGRIHTISLRDDGMVELKAKIPERYNKWVRRDSEAKIQAQGVIGANAIVFSGGKDHLQIENGQTYILKRDKAISDIVNKLEPMMDHVQNILLNVDKVSTSVSSKRTRIESILDGVGAVGEDLNNKEGSVGYLVRSDYLKDEVKAIVDQIKQIEENINRITVKVDKVVAGVNDRVDESKPVVSNTNEITGDVAETTDNLKDVRKQADDILNTTNRVLLNLEEKWPFNAEGEKKTNEKVELP